jgi:uncharacterized protein YbaP (TraB family)
MRTPSTLSFAVLSALLTCALGCEKEAPPPAPETPPQWVVEANERAREQQAEPAVPDPESEKLVEYPLLWRVTGEDGARSYVLGTLDVEAEFTGLEVWPDSVRTAFEESTTLVSEVDGDNWTDLDDEMIVTPSGNGLRKRLSKEKWERLVALTEVPGEALETFQPFMVAAAIELEWFDEEQESMDRRFGVLARAYDMKTESLMSQDEAFGFLRDMVTADDIVTMLDTEQEIRSGRSDSRKVFRAGTATRVSDFSPMYTAEYTDRELEMIRDRNRDWAEKLAARLQTDGGRFIIVPARRVVGPEGLPALLEKNPSLKVERIDAPPGE